jgi:hypothetical protein
MNSRFLTVLTLVTATMLSFSSIAKAESTDRSDVNKPEPTAVIQDGTQTITDANPPSETVDSPKATLSGRNSTQTQSKNVTDRDPQSSSDNYGHKCGEQ